MKKPNAVKSVETAVKNQLGLGDIVEPESHEPQETPPEEQPKQQEQPVQLTNIQMLDHIFQQFLSTHYVPMFELVGLFELKVVEFKEAWRLQISQTIQKNMADSQEAQQNGNSH